MTFNLQPSTLRQAQREPQREPYNLGLIGYPLGHSLSPQMHNAALRALGLEGEYRLYPVPPHPQPISLGERGVRGEGMYSLENLLENMRAGPIHGLNVTIPHKQNVIALLDELTPVAQAIGAVNAIFRTGDQLIGDNSDAPGFFHDLQRCFNLSTFQPSTALILGAGGSARAVAYALLSHGWRVTIAARRLEQANALAVDLGKLFPHLQLVTCNLQLDTLDLSPLRLIVNTTPLGMAPHPDASPWPEGTLFPENAAVYDLVYNPRETLLVKQARAAGLPAVTGLGMLIEQAALAFECWIGHQAPREAMLASVETL